MNTIDPKALREAFGSFMTGVTVVTTRDADGRPIGFTANSFASVSLAPPLLLVCPARALNSFAVFETCEYFTINVLAEGQEAVSNTFAGFQGDRFAQVEWNRDLHDCPRLADTAAYFSCRTHRVEPAGDHIILIGEIVDFACSGLRGLGFVSGQYFSLGLEHDAETAVTTGGRLFAGAIVEYADRVLLCESPNGLRPPQVQLERPFGSRAALMRWFDERELSVTLGNTYSIFEDSESGDHYTYFRADTADAATKGLGRYYPIEELPELQFASPVQASMLGRFAVEHRTQAFGLYLGNEREGDLLTYSERN